MLSFGNIFPTLKTKVTMILWVIYGLFIIGIIILHWKLNTISKQFKQLNTLMEQYYEEINCKIQISVKK